VPQSGFYGWKLLAVLWIVLLINLGFPAYGSSVINTYMAADLHLDRKMLGLPYSIFLIMSGLPGPLVALCVNRNGIRFTLLLGGVLVIVGSVLMASLVSGGVGAVLAFGILVGIGVATGGAVPTQAAVARWFVRRRALALAILLSGGAIGGFLAAPLLDWVVRESAGNWRAGWLVIAALSALVVVAIAMLVKEAPPELGQLPHGYEREVLGPVYRTVPGAVTPPAAINKVTIPGAYSGPASMPGAQGGTAPFAHGGRSGPERSAQTGRPGAPRPKRLRVHMTAEEWNYGEVLKQPSLWMMFVAALGVSFSYTIFLAHGPVHLKDLGHPASAGATAISVATLSQLLAKAVVGALGDLIDPRYIWAVFTALGGLGMLLIVHAAGVASIYAFAICLGAGFGGMLVCLMAVLSNYYGTKVYASVVGLSIAIQTTVGAIAPIVAGWAYDRYGTYNQCFYVIAAVCFGGVVLLLAVRPPKRRVSAAAGVSS
jgi:MFS family permease